MRRSLMILCAGLALALSTNAYAGIEHGSFVVTITHADGTVEVDESGPNMLFAEGQRAMEAVFHQAGTAPTGFKLVLLKTTAGTCSAGLPASGALYLNTNTWTGNTACTAANVPSACCTGNGTGTCTAINTYELTNGTDPGYASQALTRDSTGWPTLAPVATGTNNCAAIGSGYCTQIVSAQKTITASADWGDTARFIGVLATISGSDVLEAAACLSADRLLKNGDQINITYKQAQQ